MSNPRKKISDVIRKLSSVDDANPNKEKTASADVASKNEGEKTRSDSVQGIKKEGKKWGMKQMGAQAYDVSAGVATKTADIVTLGHARRVSKNDTGKIDVEELTKDDDDDCPDSDQSVNRIEKNKTVDEIKKEKDEKKDGENTNKASFSSSFGEVLHGKVLILGPLASILFRDISILAEQFLILSVVSYRNREFILEHRSLPFTAVIPFIIFSFSLGFWLCHKFYQKYEDEPETEVLIERQPTTLKLIDKKDLTGEEKPPGRKRRSSVDDSFFLIATAKRLPILSDHFPKKKEKSKKLKKRSKATDSKDFFTILSGGGSKNVSPGWDIMNTLLQNPKYRRKEATLGDGIVPTSSSNAIDDVVSSDSASSQKENSAVGKINMNNTDTASFGAEVIDPLFKLLGMDVFLTDCPEKNIWKQPLLNKCGLRSKPTFVLNILVPWANMAIYFEMPEWIKKWRDIKEEKDDPDDIKALKRFFVKDDEYRNLRFKGIPALVEAPLAIRMLKPAQEETFIASQYTPVSWHFEDECIDKDGNKQCAILEADVDLNVSGAVRKIVGLVRKHVKKIVIDLAIVITKSEEKDPEEPSACVGLWRLHKVDLEDGAVIPEKTEEESVQEVLELRQTLAANQPIAIAAGSV